MIARETLVHAAELEWAREPAAGAASGRCVQQLVQR
jgi:hypothetical protein